MKVLYLGDIVGDTGLKTLKENISYLRTKYHPNIVLVNGENTTFGKGLSFKDYKELMRLNISAITMGNHVFGHKSLYNYIDNSNVIRPLNIETERGSGYKTFSFNGKSITVINLLGQVDMHTPFTINNPFLAIDELLKKIKSDYIIVDMHAEATSEKVAMGYFLDGRVSAVLGTHSHIQTNDNRTLPKGTIYITDLGMTGARDGVLGVKKEIIIDRFLGINTEQKFVIEDLGQKQISGILLDLEKKTSQIVKEHFD